MSSRKIRGSELLLLRKRLGNLELRIYVNQIGDGELENYFQFCFAFHTVFGVFMIEVDSLISICSFTGICVRWEKWNWEFNCWYSRAPWLMSIIFCFTQLNTEPMKSQVILHVINTVKWRKITFNLFMLSWDI